MSNEEARDEVVGRKVTAVTYYEDFIEVHFEDDVVLTGYTKPFGMMGCAGVGENTVHFIVGKRVEYFEVVPNEYIAIDSGENRLAFPIDEDSKIHGPEAVRLYKPAHYELGLPAKHWIW